MNLFVGGLAKDVFSEDLHEHFGAFGEVASAKIITDKFTGEPRGFGFVEMPNQAEGEAAMNGLNGKELKGQALKINEARPREENGPRGGGGNRGGRGGSGGGNNSGRGGSGGYNKKNRY
jgi:RNA recognition motif-containing protein